MKITKYLTRTSWTMAILAVTACGSIRSLVPGGGTSSPAQGSSIQPVVPMAAASQAPHLAQTSAAPAAAPAANAGPVSLQVRTPQDGAVVNTAQVQVSGTAAPGAVVTVNDDILIAGADGTFQSTVALQEGPNLIQVVASNASGSESNAEITVTYEP